MDLKQLCEKILTPGRREAVESAVNDNSCRRISLYGLAGSSAPMLISALPSRGGGPAPQKKGSGENKHLRCTL